MRRVALGSAGDGLEPRRTVNHRAVLVRHRKALQRPVRQTRLEQLHWTMAADPLRGRPLARSAQTIQALLSSSSTSVSRGGRAAAQSSAARHRSVDDTNLARHASFAIGAVRDDMMNFRYKRTLILPTRLKSRPEPPYVGALCIDLGGRTLPRPAGAH